MEPYEIGAFVITLLLGASILLALSIPHDPARTLRFIGGGAAVALLALAVVAFIWAEAQDDPYETGADDVACKRTQNLREAQYLVEGLGFTGHVADMGSSEWGGYFRIDPPGRDIIICYYRWHGVSYPAPTP